MPNDGIDTKMSESQLPADPTGTNDLLRGILAELKNIGGQLQQQDGRLTEVERKLHGTTNNPDLEPRSSRIIGPSATPWSLVLAEIKRASTKRLTTAQAIYIHKNDLVGIDQLAKEDKRNITAKEPTAEEVREWTALVGHIWRVPDDGRLPLRFQKRWLRPDQSMRVPTDPLPASLYLQRLVDDDRCILLPEAYRLQCTLASSNLSISDYFDQDVGVRYELRRDNTNLFSGDSSSEEQGRVVPEVPTMCASGPWRRIICLRGLEYKTVQILRSPLPQHINEAIDSYKHCFRRRRDRRWVEWDADCQRFHVTYFNIQFKLPTGEVSPWKHGPLRSGLSTQILCESAYTVLLIPEYERKSESSRDYWTLLDLRPETFPVLHPNVISTLSGRIDVVQATLIVADSVMKTIKSHWKQILDYFDQLISERDTFLDPERHDDLLSDDESLSRSKTYFWAITALKELDLSISDNLLQIKRLLDTNSSTWVENSRKAELEDARSCLRIRYQEIEEITLKLREKRQEAVDLRDGLFSASAVIESRSATRLGENVKLLTFVSIFFLPLSFCMSVWSINTLFSLNSLAVVATLVALSTYLTVFNLDSLVVLFRETHAKIFSLVIRRMKQDRDGVWRERGKAFEKFSSPRKAEGKPSNWRLLQYAAGSVFWPSRSSPRDSTDSQLEDPDKGELEVDLANEADRSFKFWARQRNISSALGA